MSRTVKYYSLAILIILTLLKLAANPVVSQSPPTPTPFTTHSLFADDTCAPPCVFGLTPGQSTTEDVDVFLQNFETPLFRIDTWDNFIFTPGARHITDGFYQMIWLDFKNDKAFPRKINIGIHQSIITGIGMLINQNHRVYLKDILDAFGMPDSRCILLSIDSEYRSSLYLTLCYPELGLSADLITGLYCNTDNIKEDFDVNEVVYGSPGYQIPPSLYRGPYVRVIPVELWETWLRGEINMDCMSAWEQLPQTTMTPSPTITGVPTAAPGPR